MSQLIYNNILQFPHFIILYYMQPGESNEIEINYNRINNFVT